MTTSERREHEHPYLPAQNNTRFIYTADSLLVHREVHDFFAIFLLVIFLYTECEEKRRTEHVDEHPRHDENTLNNVTYGSVLRVLMLQILK